jgi:phage terminase large subunit
MIAESNSRFAYVAPYYVQAKDIAWNYLKTFCYPILETLGGNINESELSVTFHNETKIRLYGAENGDRMRGLGFDGVVLDEAADFPPKLWPEVLRPALSDKQGWATWIGTPKGHNAFYDMWQLAQDDPTWYRLALKASDTGILAAEELAAARRDMSQDQYAQEYECSFDAAVIGAYYAREMAQAEKDNRITDVPHDPRLPVHVSWDLGIGDSTSLWFAQAHGNAVRVIDFYESSGVGLDHYVKVLRDKPYNYADQILPHDAEVSELGTGKTRIETLSSLGISKTRVVPKASIDDGINAARLLIPRCWFDAKKCKQGLEALKMYRAEYDDKAKTLRSRPLHDWASHAADSFRYLAMGLRETPTKSKPIAYPKMGIA